MKIEEQVIMDIGMDNLLKKVEELHGEGYRLVQIHATEVDDAYEINYSFDKDFNFVNLRMKVKEDEEVPSISGIYWMAFLYENEVHEFFGIPIKDININYAGTLYKQKVKYPYSSTKGGEE